MQTFAHRRRRSMVAEKPLDITRTSLCVESQRSYFGVNRRFDTRTSERWKAKASLVA
jgi:hypothetical protein